MAKRTKLNYDTGGLISSLKRSTGKGVDALFSDPSPTPLQTNSKDRPKSTDTPNGRTERSNGSTEPNGKTERSNRTDFTTNQETTTEKNLIREMKEGPTTKANKRATVRYSFEIYVDQKSEIEELQYQYKRKTGKKISASRIIREALGEYFKKAKAAVGEKLKTERSNRSLEPND